MKLRILAAVMLLSLGCTRPSAGPPTDASVVPTAPTGSAEAGVDAATSPPVTTTVDAYCADFILRNDSPEGFSCRGDKTHATCTIDEKEKLSSLGAVALVHEQGPEGTRSGVAIVDQNRHFTMLVSVPTEDCDLGDPADVSLRLISAAESTDAGATSATIVLDSLRVDPPFQGGPQLVTATRLSIRCHPGASAPQCEKPTTLGTFEGPLPANGPPPFSKWKKR